MSVVVLTTGGTIASVRGPGDRIAVDHGRDAGQFLRRFGRGGAPRHGRGFVDDVAAPNGHHPRGGRRGPRRRSRRGCGGAARDRHPRGDCDRSSTLFHTIPRPVVLTGAQRPADHPDPDGPHNIKAAVATARRADVRGRGVLVVFGDRILPARGTRKVHTTGSTASVTTCPPATALARPSLASRRRPDPRRHPRAVSRRRPHPDRRQRRRRARGIVLDAMGSGNANPNILAAVQDCIANDIAVVVTSRVPDGVVEPIYGGARRRPRPDPGRRYRLAMAARRTGADHARRPPRQRCRPPSVSARLRRRRRPR